MLRRAATRAGAFCRAATSPPTFRADFWAAIELVRCKTAPSLGGDRTRRPARGEGAPGHFAADSSRRISAAPCASRPLDVALYGMMSIVGGRRDGRAAPMPRLFEYLRQRLGHRKARSRRARRRRISYLRLTFLQLRYAGRAGAA